MSDLENNPNEPISEANTRPSSYCQNCGKPLTPETARVVGQSVYCEPCLEAKLNGGPATSGYTRVNAGPAPAYGTDAYYRSRVDPAPGSSLPPNPGTAFLLGLIPGVGAMYNEQYAKGLVHLFIFAMLVMFAHVSGIFGMFIAGWVIYMAIEAHHTARAKRDGTPLPNPFGLNDIGERMGFGPSWMNGQGVAAAVQDAAAAAGFRPNPGPPPPVPPPQPGATAAGWGSPVDAYPNPPEPAAAPDWNQPGYPSAGGGPGYGYGYTQGYPPYGAPVPPYGAPYAGVHTGAVPPPIVPPIPRNRFPMGAVWLIALGTLFLLGTEGIFSGLRGQTLTGILFLVAGVALFARKMTASGGSLDDDGSHDYRLRFIYALRSAAWLILAGVLFLLDSFHILYWSHSWPFFIILAGVMMLLRRVVAPAPYPAYPYAPAPAPTAYAGPERATAAEPDPLSPAAERSDSGTQTGDR